MKKFLLTALAPIALFLSLLFSLLPPLPVQAASPRALFQQTAYNVPATSAVHTAVLAHTITATADVVQVQTASLPDAPFGSYACILSDDVYFYSTADARRGLFLLPKTYYVKLLEYQSDFCRVEYLYDDVFTKKLTGYVQTDQLTFVDYTPKRPYLHYVFDVQYQIADNQTNDSAFLNQVTMSCAYYGDFRIGSETYCYVLRGDVFGYVPKPLTLSYEENTEYADRLTQTQPPASQQPTSSEQTSSPAQIAILVTLCLLVPVLAAFILKPSKRPSFDPDEQN